MKEIIDNITFNYGLDSSDVCHSTIRRRETRYNSVIVTPMQGGHISSLVKFEDKLVVLFIKMTCIRYSMTPSSCLQLVNDFISGTEAENDVIEFKDKYYFTNTKEGKTLLGCGY